MCGINGLYIKEDLNNVKSKLLKMNNLIIHRGPDDHGLHLENIGDKILGLSMRRLSIIDLSNGNQPFYSLDKNVVLVFNGEIYNYKLLRKKLINSHKVKFLTQSDTEVILKLYELFGTESFKMLDGMFAFSIFDKKKNKLFLVRDFFGEKPLYYKIDKNSLYWASELKSIISILPHNPEISYEGISLFFQLSYIPAPATIYKNIFKIKPNCYLEIDLKSLEFSENRIVHEKSNKINYNRNESIQLTHDLVFKSVISRSVSDVPIGTFLSGGVDSTIISLCLSRSQTNPINTFSMGFKKKKFDETSKSDKISKIINSKHHKFIFDESDLIEFADDILLNYDEPFADSSALPTYLLSKYTKNHVKVVLTGDGGDELFGGYNKYYIAKLNSLYTKYVSKSFHKSISKFFKPLLTLNEDDRGIKYKAIRFLESINYNDDFYKRIISLGFQAEELSKLFKNDINKIDLLSNDFFLKKPKTIHEFRNIDKSISLEGDMLVKVDRASMLNSIECRSPFLNKELWNFCNQLDENLLINKWDKKFILKKAFKKYFPKGFLDKSKKGFNVPVGDWLKSALRKELLYYCETDRLKKQGIFNSEYVIKMINNHLNGSIDNTFRVWVFFCFQKWYFKTFLKI